MKRLTILMCTAVLTLLSTTHLCAQRSNISEPRSEQFILDSMRMDVELKEINTQYQMYTDSLETALEIEEVRLYSKEDQVEVLIPLGFFIMIILIVFIALYISYCKKRDRYRVIEKAIEQGVELPSTLFDEPAKRKSWISTIRYAIILIGLGIALILFGDSVNNTFFGAIAFMPMFIGMGYFIVAWIEFRQEKKASADKEHNNNKELTE